jgi:transcriptional regulator with XRE-family HTH domain
MLAHQAPPWEMSRMSAEATPTADSFVRRVREILDAKRLTIAELAERAELAASLVSKLLTETDATRREPRLEHVLAIARALELAPRELVLGTTAETILGEWVPRTEFEEESKARSAAQTEAAQLRTELAGVRSEANALRSTVDQLSQEVATATRRLGDVESAARKEQTALRVAREAAEAKLAAAIVERDRALALAQQNYQAWANARSQILQLQREVVDAKGSASAGWLAALVGTVGGAILGAAAAEPAAPVASTPRRRSVRRA